MIITIHYNKNQDDKWQLGMTATEEIEHFGQSYGHTYDTWEEMTEDVGVMTHNAISIYRTVTVVMFDNTVYPT